jgi:hypothetical protein
MAPNWPAHALVQLSGDIAGSGPTTYDEIWSCNLRVVSDSDGFLGFPDEAATAFAAKFGAWWGGIASNMSGAARLKEIKVNNITPAGHYQDAVTWSAGVGPGVGATPQGTCPAFVTVCWSWTTAKARGSASNGRIYLPNMWGTIGGGSVITGAVQTSMVASAKSFLDCVRTATTPLNGPIHPAVVSPGGLRIGPGMNRITGVRVGRVIDVQRRRKNAINESYAVSAWP